MSGMAAGPLAPFERYLDATAAPPSPELAERIGARLLLEPPSTAPRRFLWALRARDGRGIGRGLAQNARMAFRPGTRSMVLRAQAMAIVSVTVAIVGFGSVVGLAAAQHVVEELQGSTTQTRSTAPAVDAPAAVVIPLEAAAGGPGVPGWTEGPAGAAPPGLASALGRACGTTSDEAGEAEPPAGPANPTMAEGRCQDGQRAGHRPDGVPEPGTRAADRGKADPPEPRGKADPRPPKGAAKGKADRPGPRVGDKAPQVSDKGKAGRPEPKGKADPAAPKDAAKGKVGKKPAATPKPAANGRD